MTRRPLAGSRVLVVGAAGFLGSRLVERLVLERDAKVRVLVRRVMSAAPLSRFPIDLVVGDVLNRDDLRSSVQGCEVVFNCVKGKGKDAALRRAADVDGARLVVEAAAAVGARVVHVSTMAVYDRPADGTFDETSPDAPGGDLYTDTKLAGERAALQAGVRHGVSVAVVQPTAIYGPHASVYGSEILEEMQTHRLILVNGGTGICNAVYIDDAVTGLLLAATTQSAGGQRFLISGPEYPTWRDFFAGFERLLGGSRTVALSTAEALEMWRQSRERPWLLPEALRVMREQVPLRRRLLATREGAAVREVAQRVLPDTVRQQIKTPRAPAADATSGLLPVSPVRPWVVHNMARKARARIDKARNMLGYDPAFPLHEGMRLTADWALWAGLVRSVPGR
jgi:nucleoside-diphosphate-sugar epimerase